MALGFVTMAATKKKKNPKNLHDDFPHTENHTKEKIGVYTYIYKQWNYDELKTETITQCLNVKTFIENIMYGNTGHFKQRN